MGILTMASDALNSWDFENYSLNSHPRNNSREFDYEVDEWLRLKKVVNAYYKNASKRTHTGTWKAICLHSAVEYYEAGDIPPNNSLSVDLGRPTGVIAVAAKIPELDRHIPWLKNYGDPNSFDEDDKLWFSMHRIFYAPLTGRYGVSEIPAPGDIVEVDFEDRENRIGNIYIGVVEKGVGIVPDNSSGEYTGTEASSAFSNPGASPESLSTHRSSESSVAVAQSQQMDEEYDKIMQGIGAEMAEDLSESTGVRDDVASAWVNETLGRE
jgi:hypothetical protein